MPYKRPMTKKGFFKKYEYVYDAYYDSYICPAGQSLKYKTTNREGYKIYASNPTICSECRFIDRCTESKKHTKVISRHVWEEYVEEANHLRHTSYNKKIYALRAQTIERVFADIKEKHGMRFTTLRGLKKVAMQAMLTFACLNLKKLANWKWKSRRKSKIFSIFLRLFITKYKIKNIPPGLFLLEGVLSTN